MKVKIILIGFFVVVTSIFFAFTKFSVADNICAPNSGYLWWSGSWTSSMVPMSSSTKYALVNSPIYVSSLGNVGIGTMNPNYKLQVNGTTSADRFCIIPITGPVSCITSWATGTITVSGSPSSNQVAFWTGTSSISGDNNFVWNASTRSLGIGTTSPQANLHINGTTTANQFFGKFNASNIRPGTFGDIINMSTSTYGFIGSVAIETTTIPSTTSLNAKNYIRSDRGFCIGDSCFDNWGVNYWALTGTTLYPASTSWNVAIGTTTIDSTYNHKLQVAGTVGITNGGLVIGNTPQIGNWNSKVPLNNTLTSIPVNGIRSLSMTIGSDGLPIITYNNTSSQLIFIKCHSLDCSSNSSITIDTSSLRSEVIIGSDGFPVIASVPSVGSNLRVIKCNDIFCNNRSFKIVDSGISSNGVSLDIDSLTGSPIMAYFKSNSIAILRCNDSSCNGTSSTLIVISSNLWGRPIMRIGSDGLPIIAFYELLSADPPSSTLKVMKCNDMSCSNPPVITKIAEVDDYYVDISMAIGNDGLPLIFYGFSRPGGLSWPNLFVKCNSNSCNSFSTSSLNYGIVLDINNNTIYYSSMIIDSNGLPIIVFRYGSNLYLIFSKCYRADCLIDSKPVFNVVLDSNTGGFSSPGVPIAIGSDGLPIIAYPYYNYIRILKCGSENCIPYWSRR
jgi:hypothetical protein